VPKRVDHKLRHQDIAKAAFWSIAKYGFAGVTLVKVGEEMGTSIGAVTHYVKTKDEVLLLASEYASGLLIEGFKEAGEKYKGLEALRRSICQLLPLDAERAGIFSIWFGFCERAKLNSDIAGVVEQRYGGYPRLFARLIKAAQKEGEIDPDINPSFAADNLVAMIDGIGLHNLVSKGGLPPKKQRQHMEKWIETTLRPKKKVTRK